MDNAARAPVLDAPSTTTGTASGASSTSATVTQGQLQLTAITPDGGFSQVSFSDSGTATPPVFESVSDIGKTAAMLGAALDTVILTASEQGFRQTAFSLRNCVCWLLPTWKNAGCNWRAVKRTACRRRCLQWWPCTVTQETAGTGNGWPAGTVSATRCLFPVVSVLR
ncbi:hypothetical protein OH693_08165 [Escherichia coli]|nr:hypothetical protein [Escherichia coli]